MSQKITVVLLLLVMLIVVQCEPVKQCINEGLFNWASCKTIREHISGKWAEVRRLPLPFLMYEDTDCVEREVSGVFMNRTHAKYFVSTQIDGADVEGIETVVMHLVEDETDPKICHVEMRLSVPKLNITKHIKNWWITFDEKGQVMIGYTCIDNFKEDEIAKGLLKRNMAFVYVEPQLTVQEVRSLKKSMNKMSQRLGYMVEKVQEEGADYFSELAKSKCSGY